MLVREDTHLIVTLLQGVSSLHFTPDTIRVIILCVFKIKKLYYTFINSFIHFHTFKHVYIFLKIIVLQSNPLTCACLLHSFGMLLKMNLFNYISSLFPLAFPRVKMDRYSSSLTIRAAYCLNFKSWSFLVTQCIERYFFYNKLTGK